jgi:cytochrome c oxidase subunit I
MTSRAVVTDVAPRPVVGAGLLEWLTTTDAKRVGILYMTTAMAYFLLGGVLALTIRSELAVPGLQLTTLEGYDQLFTMHGTIMMFLFATPMVAGLANYIMPLQIGAADVVFPRLNALSFWMFLFGGLVIISGYLVQGGPADIGWTGYPPNSELQYSTTVGTDLWIVGLALVGIASIFGSINFIATIYTRRAPGMSMLRMPMFTWTILVTSILILFAFPALTAALAMLLIDRRFGGQFFQPGTGDPVMWQHLFWFFGHPEVYILALPFFGIISEVIPVFSGKPLFGYKALVFATVAIGSLSMAVWAHHMFTTGAINVDFFSLSSLAIAVPTGIKFFNWLATMWHGRLRLETPMVFAIGFLYLFLLGGISGVIVASPALDFQFQDTYFVVAHLHNVLFGGTVFAMFAGIYFWFPKITGRRLDERLGKVHFWLWVIGFVVTFLPQYQLGADGMPRRIADYPADAGWTLLNMISTIGAFTLAVGIIPFLINVAAALRRPADQPADPWGANSLEWATTSPPPPHNFRTLPPIRSERPVRDARLALAAAGGGFDPAGGPGAARAGGPTRAPEGGGSRDAPG